MRVIDQGIAFWEKRSDSAGYTPDELAEAIEFFESITGIASNAMMTFIGPIPDENLKKATVEWEIWYESYRERLVYEPVRKRVVVR